MVTQQKPQVFVSQPHYPVGRGWHERAKATPIVGGVENAGITSYREADYLPDRYPQSPKRSDARFAGELSVPAPDMKPAFDAQKVSKNPPRTAVPRLTKARRNKLQNEACRLIESPFYDTQERSRIIDVLSVLVANGELRTTRLHHETNPRKVLSQWMTNTNIRCAAGKSAK